ncbi:MAG: 5'/3'-nucleotidase SurE [Rhizobiales bacterium]|nr:5'/3'-nucleotidase SurE [Hyphomicrobiales bacterium]
MIKLNSILIVNDDGIDAVGMKSMIKIAQTICEDVWVVAPTHEQSGVSRAVSVHNPIYVERRAEKRFAIDGTPADCVIMAIEVLMNDKPDLILSGVNRGHNAADFLHISGTVGGAGMGSTYHIPSMALSLMGNIRNRSLPLEWEMVEHFAPELIEKLFNMSLDAQSIQNLNFPNCSIDNVKGIKVCEHGKRQEPFIIVDKRENLRGSDYYWINFKGIDENPQINAELASLQDNYITVTAVTQNLTNFAMNDDIKNQL